MIESFPTSPDYSPSTQEVKRFLSDPRFDLQILRFLSHHRVEHHYQIMILRNPEIIEIILGYLQQEKISVLKILAYTYLIHCGIPILNEVRKIEADLLASMSEHIQSPEFAELQDTIRFYGNLKSPEERMEDEELRRASLSPTEK